MEPALVKGMKFSMALEQFAFRKVAPSLPGVLSTLKPFHNPETHSLIQNRTIEFRSRSECFYNHLRGGDESFRSRIPGVVQDHRGTGVPSFSGFQIDGDRSEKNRIHLIRHFLASS